MRTLPQLTSHAVSALLLAGTLALGVRQAAAQTTVGGVAYAQFNYQTSDTANHTNAFDITRAYINVLGRFGGGVGTRVTADVYRNTDGSLAYRLKYAFVTWTPEGSPLTFKLGQMHTAWVDWEESLWNYRMQGTIAVDRNGYMSSSDFGAGVDGTFDHDRFNFQAGVYNGENYNKATGDQHKDLQARASYRLLGTDDGSRVGGLRVTGYAQFGKPTTGGQRNRFLGMLSYRSNDITFAAEYAAATDSTTGPAAVPQRKGTVLSVYGVFHLPNTRFSLIGRMDAVDPNTASTSTTDKQTRFIVGAAYQLSPNLRLLADVDHVGYQSGHTVTAAEQVAQTALLFQAMFTF
jgi:hypothetical protein